MEEKENKQQLANIDNELIELAKVESLILEIEQQKKIAEEQANKLRDSLLNAMINNSIKTFENDNVKIVTKTTQTWVKERLRFSHRSCTNVIVLVK